MNASINEKADFWYWVQSPGTHVRDVEERVRLAWQAIDKFNDPHISASAICVIVYRVIDGAYELKDGEAARIIEHTAKLREVLELKNDFQSVRWFLSLGMAVAAFQLLMGNATAALDLLVRNLCMMEKAAVHGQPVTNVVKSGGIILGMFKEYGVPAGKEWLLEDILAIFMAIKGDIFTRYKFDFHYVYEELAVVFRVIYAVTSVAAAKKAKPDMSIAEQLETFDARVVAAEFVRIFAKGKLEYK